MSKVSMPRPRYVAFRIEAPASVSRRALANALKGRARHEGWSDADAPQLTRYAFPHGIVRVEHTYADRARELLPRITWAVDERAGRLEFRLTTLSTAGTLRSLTDRLGILRQRDEPRPAQGPPPSTGRPPSAPPLPARPAPPAANAPAETRKASGTGPARTGPAVAPPRHKASDAAFAQPGGRRRPSTPTPPGKPQP